MQHHPENMSRIASHKSVSRITKAGYDDYFHHNMADGKDEWPLPTQILLISEIKDRPPTSYPNNLNQSIAFRGSNNYV